jgi:hypothetical protein
MQTRNRGDYTIAGCELVAEGADLRSLGFADTTSMFRYFSKPSFSPKRHQLGP